MKIKKPILIVLAPALVLALTAYIWSAKKPETFVGTATINLGQKIQNAPNQFAYNNFYAISATSNLLDTVNAWLTSPNYVTEIYREAKAKLPSQSPEKLSRVIKIKKDFQNSNSSFFWINSDSRKKAQDLADSAKKILERNFAREKENQNIPQEFQLQIGNPTIIKQEKKTMMDTAIGFLGGAIIGGLFLIAFLEYTKKTAKS